MGRPKKTFEINGFLVLKVACVQSDPIPVTVALWRQPGDFPFSVRLKRIHDSVMQS